MGDINDTWRHAGLLKSDDPLDESLLERLSDRNYAKTYNESEKVKRDLIKFYIYYTKAVLKLYDDPIMSSKIIEVNPNIPSNQISWLVGTYMSGRHAKIHPDDETITKLSDMYDQIMTNHSGSVNRDTVQESSDNYDHRQQQRSGGERSRSTSRPRDDRSDRDSGDS